LTDEEGTVSPTSAEEVTQGEIQQVNIQIQIHKQETGESGDAKLAAASAAQIAGLAAWSASGASLLAAASMHLAADNSNPALRAIMKSLLAVWTANKVGGQRWKSGRCPFCALKKMLRRHHIPEETIMWPADLKWLAQCVCNPDEWCGGDVRTMMEWAVKWRGLLFSDFFGLLRGCFYGPHFQLGPDGVTPVRMPTLTPDSQGRGASRGTARRKKMPHLRNSTRALGRLPRMGGQLPGLPKPTAPGHMPSASSAAKSTPSSSAASASSMRNLPYTHYRVTQSSSGIRSKLCISKEKVAMFSVSSCMPKIRPATAADGMGMKKNTAMPRIRPATAADGNGMDRVGEMPHSGLGSVLQGLEGASGSFLLEKARRSVSAASGTRRRRVPPSTAPTGASPKRKPIYDMYGRLEVTEVFPELSGQLCCASVSKIRPNISLSVIPPYGSHTKSHRSPRARTIMEHQQAPISPLLLSRSLTTSMDKWAVNLKNVSLDPPQPDG
jgi:hypothetical protein